MGGKVAMQLAMTESDMLERLIVVDIGPDSYTDRHSHILEALDKVTLEGVTGRKDVESQLLKSLTNHGIVSFLMKNLKRKQGGFQWRMNLPGILNAYPRLMDGLSTNNSFDGETLFVRGANSDYIRQEETRLIYELFPQAKIETIENAGHWVHADQPDKLLSITLDFLDK